MRIKKGQEEIIGFVLIIVLVAIIALVFLAINLRRAPEKLPSTELESFLQASMRYGTDCFSSPEIRYNLKDLIVACDNREKCMNDADACDVLNKTLMQILKENWNPGAENPNKYYGFKAYNQETNRTIASLKEGVCTGTMTFSDISIPSLSGDLKAELEICS